MCDRTNYNFERPSSFSLSSHLSADHSPFTGPTITNKNNDSNFGFFETNSQPCAFGVCAVCGDRADGHHYGVLSCRGCNAFFRRAVTFNLQFHCRREGNCNINKDARCACRACRLQKCQSVGMDRSAVQVRREMKDVLALGDAQQRSAAINSTAELLLSPQQSSVTPLATNSLVLGSGKALDLLPVRARLLGSASSVSSPLAKHYFDRLVECYFCQRYRRQTMLCQTAEQILALIASGGPTAAGEKVAKNFGDWVGAQKSKVVFLPSLSKSIIIFHATCCISHSLQSATVSANCQSRIATEDDICQVRRVETVLMFEWVDQLEEFKRMEMEPMDKIRLLRAFAPRFLLLDFLLHSLECHSIDCLLLPNGAAFVSSSGVTINHWQEGQSYPKDKLGQKGNDGVMEMLSLEAEAIVRTLLGPLADIGVTFGQMIAFRLLLLWDCSVPLESVVSADIVRQAAQRTRNELAEWLEQQQSIGAGEGKMDNLFDFLPILCAFAAKFASICGTIANFHVMPEWQFMADLLDEQKTPCIF